MWAPRRAEHSAHTVDTDKYIVVTINGQAVSCGRDGLVGGEEGEGARVCVYEGERATTYGNSDGGRRRRGSAGEQAVQSAQDRMEYDAHGGALTTVKQYYRFENDEITPL